MESFDVLGNTFRGVWKAEGRPGYFGRRRDASIANYNESYGSDNWKLAWFHDGEIWEYADVCRRFYEESYFRYLKNRPDDLDFICSHGECIDNASTNVDSGLDYTIQEASSTHIQDIAVRNVLHRLDRHFTGPKDKILVIRSKDSEGYRFGPGNIPFYDVRGILQPSKCPSWANKDSVEDFYQSNKLLLVRL